MGSCWMGVLWSHRVELCLYHPHRPAGELPRAPGGDAAPAGPARQVAAPPRGRRAERNAPAAPARRRATVGVASRPRLSHSGCGAAGRARLGRPLAAGPVHLHTGRARSAEPAGARGGRGRRRSWAESRRRPRAGVAGDARGVPGRRAGARTGQGQRDRTAKLEGREGSGAQDDPSARTAVPPGAGQPLPTAHCAAPDPLCV